MTEQCINLKTALPKPEQALTIQDNKSTKRIHLALKGFVNLIVAGQNAIDAKGSLDTDLNDKIL